MPLEIVGAKSGLVFLYPSNVRNSVHLQAMDTLSGSYLEAGKDSENDLPTLPYLSR